MSQQYFTSTISIPTIQAHFVNAIVRGSFGVGRIVASKSVNGVVGYSVVMLYQTASGALVTPDHPTRLWKWEGEIS